MVVFDVDGFELDGFKTPVPEGGLPARFENVKRLTVKNSPVLEQLNR
jgi:hypothetical protein